MRARSVIVLAVVSALALAAPAVCQAPGRFALSESGGRAVALATNTAPIFLRRSGIPGIDDTIAFDAGGMTQHVSGWQTIDLTAYGVPADALLVDLGVRAVLTKSEADSTATVWLHARAYGSDCCRGPDGHEAYPLEGAWGGQPSQDGMIAQTVAQLPRDGRRDTSSWPVRVQEGKIQLSWGYRRAPGDWPAGDAVAIVVYLNGWSR